MRPSFGPEAVTLLVKHARPAAPQQALSKKKKAVTRQSSRPQKRSRTPNQYPKIGDAVAVPRRAHRKPITGLTTNDCRRLECTRTSLKSWQRLRSSLACSCSLLRLFTFRKHRAAQDRALR
jgi:hypothetical protein